MHNTNVVYRIGQPQDVDTIAKYLALSSGGISDFLLHDILPNCKPEDLIAMGVADEAATIYHNNTIVAVLDGQIIGVITYYPAEQHVIPDIMRAFIPKKRIKHMEPLLTSRVDDSLYIYSIAVAPEYTRYNAGINLVMRCAEIAKAMGYHKLSAHVWVDNTRVYNALKMNGFTIVERLPIARHQLLPHDGGMVLMAGDIPEHLPIPNA